MLSDRSHDERATMSPFGQYERVFSRTDETALVHGRERVDNAYTMDAEISGNLDQLLRSFIAILCVTHPHSGSC